MNTGKTHFGNFTNLYSLQKTLRFELVPVGKDGKRVTPEDAAKLFAKILEQDRKIKNAYVALKPIMDKIHEEVINTSLNSEGALKIDFSNYFEEYKKGKERKLDKFEMDLRDDIGKTFEKTANNLANNAGNDKKGKPIFKRKKDKDAGVKYLTQAGMLKYIEKNISQFVPQEQIKEFIYEQKVTNSNGKKQIEAGGYLTIFSRFFGYFSGYNQNRENYYAAKEEKATAVATRIVHDNLPKFCDNSILFTEGKIQKKTNKTSDKAGEVVSRKEEYLNAHQYLKDNNRTTQIKDSQTNAMIEAELIDEKMFDIARFPEFLSQAGIEKYNKIIGHYNLLINLYNQARQNEKDFRRLLPFKILYKQIGCGEKKALFYELKYDTKRQQDACEKTNDILNVEEALKKIKNIGETYFGNTDNKNTVHHFINWLKQTKDWGGIYWSKQAVEKISNKYLANWYYIKDRIQRGLQGNDKHLKGVCETIASYKKNREEQLQINDAVELSGLFEVLDQEKDNGWSEVFFKKSVLEDRKSLINEKITPSQNLIAIICADLDESADGFCTKSEEISRITDYKNEKNVFEIKKWLDTAKQIIWIIKYFDVKESKVKGTPINSELSNMLSEILHTDDMMEFNRQGYDAVRNYLTKRPQDDAKKNKLKLNFNNPHLLGGWSDGQEMNKSSVLLKNDNKLYVGILNDRSLFDTRKKNNEIYNFSDKNTGRLILRNLAFKTLAGKGFVRDYNEKYGNMGKRNPEEAIHKLQSFIKKNYVFKYPLLNQVVNKEYSEKKKFDKEIQKVLTECYECDFAPIRWDLILKYVAEEKLYLFEIYSKDFSHKKGEKSKNSKVNLQTKYWENVFQEGSPVQLCGGGEIFFRRRAIMDEKVTHPANQSIERRTDKKIESIFSHDIIKDKRFRTDKYFFHIPLKINYQAPEPGYTKGKVNLRVYNQINEKVNDMFTQTDDIRFLGIDRGEKHLIYYSLVDAQGNIIEQDNFDVINKKDYLQEINEAARKRRENQENWQQKGNISNLKDGYISLVIHEIIQKMKDKDEQYLPTFIVLESLNQGFKRRRQKFEQQVYQKFELALAKKLNYLVDKNARIGELGSVAKALQLTPPVANYQDIENRRQFGIMLYTRAQYTSVTDPLTGWRKTIYLKKVSEENIKDQIFEKFSEIGVDNQGDYYFKYNQILELGTDKKIIKAWTLWSGKNGKSLERYRFTRRKAKNEGVIESYAAKEMLDKLFTKFDKKKSLLEQLKEGKALSKIDEKNTAWESLRFMIDIIQQIRNSGDKTKNQEENFLLSPVRDENGEHFDSREYQSRENPALPKDADANGAYNIARKGIIMYNHTKQWIKDGKRKIKGNDGKETTDLNLFISDTEWDLWAADEKQWQKYLNIFASKKM